MLAVLNNRTFVHVHLMNTDWGGSCKDIVPLIHDLNGGEWSPSPQSRFTPGKGNSPLHPPVPRPKNRSGFLGEEENI